MNFLLTSSSFSTAEPKVTIIRGIDIHNLIYKLNNLPTGYQSKK
jgi:hypothetical protein